MGITAKILSFSIDDKAEKDFENAVREFGFKNRSEMVRAAVHTLMAEKSELSKLHGLTTAVAVVVHSSEGDEAVAEIRHAYSDIISTHVHNSSSGECLQVFVLNGSASRIVQLAQELKKNRRVKYSKIVSTKTG